MPKISLALNQGKAQRGKARDATPLSISEDTDAKAGPGTSDAVIININGDGSTRDTDYILTSTKIPRKGSTQRNPQDATT